MNIPKPARPAGRGPASMLLVLLSIVLLSACGDTLLEPIRPHPPAPAESDSFLPGAFASQQLLECYQWQFHDGTMVWKCVTEGDPIGFTICQNGEEPPACISEQASEPPAWEPADSTGPLNPGFPDGEPDAPTCGEQDDTVCEGTEPPALICPQSVSFGTVAQCQLNLNGNAVAGTEWRVSGPDFTTRTSGGTAIVQQFWGGEAVTDFQVTVDLWRFDGGSSANNTYWQQLSSGTISVTRSAAQPWSSASDWSVDEDVATACSTADGEPGSGGGFMGITYGKEYGCVSAQFIAPDYTSFEGIETESVASGWQEGLHYVVSSSYSLPYETRINPHLNPSHPAASHVVAHQEEGYYTQMCPEGQSYTFYQMNVNCGAANFGTFRSAVVTHERRHATRGREKMTEVDPRVAVWELVAETEAALLAGARDVVAVIDGNIRTYVVSLDGALYEQTPIWSGEITYWSGGLWQVIPVKVAWDGGGSP